MAGNVSIRLGSPKCLSRGSRRGVTLIELLVVVSLVAILAVSIGGGLSRYQTRYKVISAATRVDSALHYARNLAIANNAVYHVRFENVYHTEDVAFNPAAQLNKPSKEQVIAIYCFPDMGRAMNVLSEAGPSGQPAIWNPFPSMKKRVKPADEGGTVTAENSGGARDHDNYLIEKHILPDGVYFGFQYLTIDAEPPYDTLLFFAPDGTMYFSPDGTSRTSATIFVTDNLEYADDRTIDSATHAARQENRRIFFNTKKPPVQNDKNKQHGTIRMIQVFGGGLIKQLGPGASI